MMEWKPTESAMTADQLLAVDAGAELVGGAAAGTGCFLASGTRKFVWQYWHLTSFPRTSSGTIRIFRQRRLGQIN
jgi:hypothetical protein